MNLNLSKILKENSFEAKDAKSINNWFRVLDTSGMTVVDQLILDNHRRQLLNSLLTTESSQKDPPSQPKKSAFSTVQNFPNTLDMKDPNISFKTCDGSFLSELDPQACALRLYSDATRRETRLKKIREEKDLKEYEEALNSANSFHPKRKLDPEVFNRLTHDEKTIRSLYEKENLHSRLSTKPARLSSAEQKASVERLIKKRDSSCSRTEVQNQARRLNQEEVSSMIDRLYKVKKPCDHLELKTRPKNIRKKNKKIGDLKSSKRYTENNEKLSEVGIESICEAVESNEGCFGKLNSDLKISPDGESLEVKLIRCCEEGNSILIPGLGKVQGLEEQDKSIKSFKETQTDLMEGITDCFLNRVSVATELGRDGIIQEIKEYSSNLDNNLEKSSEVLITQSFVIDKPPEMTSENFILSNDLTPSSDRSTNHSLKSLLFPKSIYLEPEDLSSRGQTTYSQESLFLMHNPLHSLPPSSPTKLAPCVLDSYRFVVGITEDDEFIYQD